MPFLSRFRRAAATQPSASPESMVRPTPFLRDALAIEISPRELLTSEELFDEAWRPFPQPHRDAPAAFAMMREFHRRAGAEAFAAQYYRREPGGIPIFADEIETIEKAVQILIDADLSPQMTGERNAFLALCTLASATSRPFASSAQICR
ncbi:MAG TPA: hypothetical protein VFG15_03335 [Amycolatopsis sp.]|nr:hypothetical protein [Amycolatopsis sp.]